MRLNKIVKSGAIALVVVAAISCGQKAVSGPLEPGKKDPAPSDLPATAVLPAPADIDPTAPPKITDGNVAAADPAATPTVLEGVWRHCSVVKQAFGGIDFESEERVITIEGNKMIQVLLWRTSADCTGTALDYASRVSKITLSTPNKIAIQFDDAGSIDNNIYSLSADGKSLSFGDKTTVADATAPSTIFDAEVFTKE